MTTTQCEDVAREAWRRMRALTHHPDMLRATHEVAEEAGISPALGRALTHLDPGRQLPMRDLASALRCDASYVTAVVDGLEEHGLAERMPHPTDRRVKVISLTPKGEDVRTRVLAAIDRPPASLVTALTKPQLEQLIGLLRRLPTGS